MAHTRETTQRRADDARVIEEHRIAGRVIEEHRIAGRHDEGETDASDGGGRRWYHLRPEPRGRTDLIGFNSTWWMAVVCLVVILLAVYLFPWWS